MVVYEELLEELEALGVARPYLTAYESFPAPGR